MQPSTLFLFLILSLGASQGQQQLFYFFTTSITGLTWNIPPTSVTPSTLSAIVLPFQGTILSATNALFNATSGTPRLPPSAVFVSQITDSASSSQYTSARLLGNTASSLTITFSLYLTPTQATALNAVIPATATTGGGFDVLLSAAYLLSPTPPFPSTLDFSTATLITTSLNAYSPLHRAYSTATSTGSTISSSLSLGFTIDSDPAAKATVLAGSLASAVTAIFLAATMTLSACMCPCKTPPSPYTMNAWKPRAGRALACLTLTAFAQALGLVTGLAAPAIPWLTLGFSASTIGGGGGGGGGGVGGAGGGGTLASSTPFYIPTNLPLASVSFSALTVSYSAVGGGGTVVSVFDADTLAGAVIAYGALAFLIFPALLLTWCAQCRTSALRFHASPPPTTACCGPSLPAIQGLSWVGCLVFLAGAAYDWWVLGVLRSLAVLGGVGGVGPGGSLMAFSWVCLFVAALCGSVTGCLCAGNMPGVGAAKGNCCCVERDGRAQPPEAAGSGGSKALSPSPVGVRNAAGAVAAQQQQQQQQLQSQSKSLSPNTLLP